MIWTDRDRTGWNLPVDLSRVATPFEQCVTVSPGLVTPDEVALLARYDFDQAPVASKQSVYGIVETSYLRELLASGRALELDDPSIIVSRLGVVSPLGEVFRTLGIHRAAIVVFDTGEREGEPYEYIGMITISDLDRHAFRSVIYMLLAELETAFADLIGRSFTDPWDWIRLLSEDHQALVLGHWELAKRKGVDIGPIAATTLTNVLTIAAKSEHLREKLGFPSKTQVEKVAGGLPDLRNRVMHPVRPLILGTSDVEELRSLLDRAIDLTRRAAVANPVA